MSHLFRVRSDAAFSNKARKLKKHKKSSSLSACLDTRNFGTSSRTSADDIQQSNMPLTCLEPSVPEKDPCGLTTKSSDTGGSTGMAQEVHQYAVMLLQAAEASIISSPAPLSKTSEHGSSKPSPDALISAVAQCLRDLPVVPHPLQKPSMNSDRIPAKRQYRRPSSVPMGARAPPNSPVGTLSLRRRSAQPLTRSAWDVDAGRFGSLVGVSKAIMEDNLFGHEMGVRMRV